MSTLVSLDPGIRGCGVAVFRDTTLIWGGYVRNPIKQSPENDPPTVLAMARAVDGAVWKVLRAEPKRVVFEWPRVYTAGKSKGDPNDLPPLVGVSMAVCALLSSATPSRVYPYEWKGQLPKAACAARVMQRLTEEEQLRVDWVGSKDHNTLDAIGIGLFALGRFDRVRVIPR